MSSTRAAVAVAGLAGAMSLVALWLVIDADAWASTTAHDVPVDVAIGVSYAAAAVLVLSGTGGRRIGWLLLGIGCCGAGAAISSAVALTGTGSPLVVRVAASVESWIWVGGFVPLLTLVPLLYPDGRLLGPRWRPWVVTSTAGMVLLAVGSATYPGGVPELLFLAGALTLAPSCIAGLAAQAIRWRRADELVRRQVAVLLVTAAVLRRQHAAPAAPVVAGGRTDPGGRGGAGARGHRHRRDPAPALRPRPRGVPGDRRAEPRRLPGRHLRQPVPARLRRAAWWSYRRCCHRGCGVWADAPPARSPAEPRRRPDVLRRSRRSHPGPGGDRHRAARGPRSHRGAGADLHRGPRVAAARLGGACSRR